MKPLRTLIDWNAEGRQIKKGSKAIGFDDYGNALFSQCQTRKNRVVYFKGDNPDDIDYDPGLWQRDYQ